MLLAYISQSEGIRQIRFAPIDFLMEAINEFLESGANPTKIASCVIKIATATELLVKEKLERLCPTLVLNTIDDEALQVIKIHGLSRELLNPKEIDGVDIKTAPFHKLLRRAGHFFDLEGFAPDLLKLQRLRNGLVHHCEGVDVAEVNLLLIKRIFPFLEQFTKDDRFLQFRMKPDTWKKLHALAESSSTVLATELSKKLTHHADLAKKLSAKRADLLLTAQPEKEADEEILDDKLSCPACKNQSLTAIAGWYIDVDEAGHPESGSRYLVMRCRVCGLELEDSEIEIVIDAFDKFFGKDQEKEKPAWENAVAEPDSYDYGESER